jgi:4-alpha-glucanotransferase
LRHAGAVRIDHILGFQRLWWIPAGASASEGTYVSYPTDELIALACLEAWRRDATLIGEDLGTVDPAVRQAMSEHGIAGTRVAIFELEAGSSAPLQPTPGSCALVDTHDTATFAGFVDGSDIDQRLELGLVDETEAQAQHRSRAQVRNALSERFGEIDDDPASLHAGVLEELGRSEAGVVMAGIEDFWAEHDPQNIPGTLGAHRNFARRMSEPLHVIETDTVVTDPLLRLAAARRSAPEPVHTAPEPVERAAPVGRATGGQHAAGACTGLGEGKVSA